MVKRKLHSLIYTVATTDRAHSGLAGHRPLPWALSVLVAAALAAGFQRFLGSLLTGGEDKGKKATAWSACNLQAMVSSLR